MTDGVFLPVLGAVFVYSKSAKYKRWKDPAVTAAADAAAAAAAGTAAVTRSASATTDAAATTTTPDAAAVKDKRCCACCCSCCGWYWAWCKRVAKLQGALLIFFLAVILAIHNQGTLETLNLDDDA